MIKSLFIAASALVGASADCDKSQLVVTLWDSFGDGWDTAYWRATDPSDNVATFQPTCGDAEILTIDPCDHSPLAGNYTMDVSTMDDSLPEGSWEVYWRVDVVDTNGDPTGTYLEGGYGTSMTWEFDGDAWTLSEYENEANNDCIACSGSKCSKSKSKSKKKSKKTTSKKKAKKLKSNVNYSPDSSNFSSYDVYTYGSPNTDLSVEMRAPKGSAGWNDISPIGARWTISDVTNTEVFETGSLCKGKKGECNICLGDGTYIFRATSEVDDSNTTAVDFEDEDRRLLLKNGPKHHGGHPGGSAGDSSNSSDSNYTWSMLKGKPKIGGGGGDGDSSNSSDSNYTWSMLKGKPKIGGGDGDSSNSSDSSSDSNFTWSMLKHGASVGGGSNSSDSNSSSSSSNRRPSPKPRPSHDAWKFCHTGGNFGDELTFHIKNGKCYPDVLTWAGETCEPEESSLAVVGGVVSLEGMKSEIFQSRDYSVVLAALAESVSGWDFKSMQVTATSLHGRSLATTYSHDIEFTVSFTTEDFGVEGSLYAAAEALVADMAATLQAAISTGAFVTTLTKDALMAGSDAVAAVEEAKLVSLEIISITYANNRLVYYYDSESTASVASSSNGPALSASVVVVFVAVIALAGVAVVGMMAHSYGSYQKISTVTDSEVSEKVWLSGMKSKFGVKFEKLPAESDREFGLKI